MRKELLLSGLVALLVGCASVPGSKTTGDHPEARAQVQRRLREIFDAAEKKDFDRLDSYHLYSPQFTKFSSESHGRQDAETARQGEHVGLLALRDLSMQAENLQIDLFGDVAVATFIFDYSFRTGSDTVRNQALSTLVFVKDGHDWKIAHEHFSARKAAP